MAPRLSRPVLAYGLLELGIAIAALAVPLGIAASRWLYVALFGSQEVLPDAGGLTTALFYLACSFLILLVPTAMMGATLPLLVRYSVRSDREIGRRIGVLYATNTAGAVLGTIAGAFVLLPALGLRATIAAAAGVNALVFAAAWAVSRSAPALAPQAAAAPADATAGGRARWILALIFASGFVSFSYEVLWVRLVGHVVGSGAQAFATMLASFLAGIAIGAAIASRLASSRAARGARIRPRPARDRGLLARGVRARGPDPRLRRLGPVARLSGDLGPHRRLRGHAVPARALHRRDVPVRGARARARERHRGARERARLHREHGGIDRRLGVRGLLPDPGPRLRGRADRRRGDRISAWRPPRR